VSLTTCVEHLRIDSTSVVANAHAQVVFGIFKFELDAFSSGMTKGVEQGFPANSINLIVNLDRQLLLPAVDYNAKGRVCAGIKLRAAFSCVSSSGGSLAPKLFSITTPFRKPSWASVYRLRIQSLPCLEDHSDGGVPKIIDSPRPPSTLQSELPS
jgi:hypothetical protein